MRKLPLSKLSRWIIFCTLMLLVSSGLISTHPSNAAYQQGPRVLASGVDINGQGFPLVVIDLSTGTSTTLATFADRPVCQPSVFPPGLVIMYELSDAANPSAIYQVNVVSGQRTALPLAHEIPLSCPVIAPDGATVAWLRLQERNNEQGNRQRATTLVLTDVNGGILADMVTLPAIFDVKWSPGGSALVYYVTTDTTPFPLLYSLPREGNTAPRLVWRQEYGLLEDYKWIANGSGLLVAYYTEMALNVALLSTDCVIGPGDPCEFEPILSLSPQASIILHDAFSPDFRQTLITLTEPDAQGSLETDLWKLDLTGKSPLQRITATPNIIETDAHWSPDASQLYFIGSQIHPEAETLRGSIYRLNLSVADAEPVLVFESSVFSPSLFLWWYE